MDPVVHFEMPVKDGKRAIDFYSKTFGWNLQQLGPEMGNYILAMTTETDEKTQRPKMSGAINGGLFGRTKPEQVPSVVISVGNIQDAMKKVTAAGGEVLGGQKPGVPDDIPGIGLYVSFTDTEGNRVGMLEPKGM